MSNNGINSATNGRTSANNTRANTTVNTVTASTAATNSSTLAGGAIQKHTNNSQTSNNIAIASNAATTINATVNNTNKTTTSISFKTTGTPLPNKQQQHQHSHSQQQQQQQQQLLKSHNNEHVHTTTAAATAAATSTTLKHPLVNINVNTNRIQTHRRDSSSVSGHHNSHTGGGGGGGAGGGGIHLPQSLKDASKYRYIKPQTIYRADADDSAYKSKDEIDARGEDNINHDHYLVYYDDQLIAGSLDNLIEHMVPTSDYYPERTYTFSFLLSVRLFIRPHELLAKISQTWEKQQEQQHQHQQQQQQSGTAQDQVDDAGHFTNSPLLQRKPGQMVATQTQKSAQNCIRLLAEWIETFPYDFRDERLMQQVRILTRKCVYIDNALGKQVSRILQLLVQRLTALEKYEEFLQSLLQNDLNTTIQPHYSTSASASYSSSSSSASSTTATHNSLTKSAVQALNSHDLATAAQKNHYLLNAHQFAHHINSSATPASCNSSGANNAHSTDSNTNSHDVFGIMDLCQSCAHLAHQLTAIELERLSHIGPEEFVQAFAKEYQNSISKNSSSTQSNSHNSGSHQQQQHQHQQIMQTSLNDMKKTRNLESYVEWFNRLSYLTASEIVKVGLR